MLEVSVYDTKSYDREYITASPQSSACRWRFHEFRLSAETALAAKSSSVVCVFVNDRVDEECLAILAEQGTKLIALRCAGYNNVHVSKARALGMRVVRVPAYSPHAVAEHTVGLLLTLNRKIHTAYNRVRELNFSLRGLVGFDVARRRVGIVGTGAIGKITAQIFRGFDAEVIASDPNPHQAWADQHQVRYVTQDELFAVSDIISLHLPLLPSTHHLVNEETLAKTKKGVFLLNTSRGKLIDTAALIRALKRGDVGGVGLDVYEEEEGIFFEDLSGKPLQDDELSQLLMYPNVLITAHQGFLTHEALQQIASMTIGNILAFDAAQAFSPGTELI